MIRLHDSARWRSCDPNGFIKLGVEGVTPLRTIRLEVNCPERTRVDVAFEDGTEMFLANVDGYEKIEFTGSGAVVVGFKGKGYVWFFTDDGRAVTVPPSEGAKSFTKLMNRRARNMEVELMMFKMEQNINRRIAALTAEYEARLDNLSVGEFDDETGEEGRGLGPASGAGQSVREPEGGSGEPEPEQGSEGSKPAARAKERTD